MSRTARKSARREQQPDQQEDTAAMTDQQETRSDEQAPRHSPDDATTMTADAGSGPAGAGGSSEGEARKGRRGRQRERSAGGLMALIEKAFGGPPPASTDDRYRRAAEDLEVSTAEANQRLMAAVPGAKTPEEAAAKLEQNQRLVDVEGTSSPGLLFPPDLADTLVQYRIRSHLDSRQMVGFHEKEIGRMVPAAKGTGQKRQGGLARNGRLR